MLEMGRRSKFSLARKYAKSATPKKYYPNMKNSLILCVSVRSLKFERREFKEIRQNLPLDQHKDMCFLPGLKSAASLLFSPPPPSPSPSIRHYLAWTDSHRAILLVVFFNPP